MPGLSRNRSHRRAAWISAPAFLLAGCSALAVLSCGGAQADRAAEAPREPWRKSAMAKWQKPEDSELRARLNDLQYRVTQKEGTEAPFRNEYWDNEEPGIYVDVVSGEPLFSSLDKYKSGTGWPSFWEPLEKSNVVEKVDKKLFMTRTEVRSSHGDSHLGHVFDDGPKPTGLRYCINSLSLDLDESD